MADRTPPSPYRVLERKRFGETLEELEIAAAVTGAASGAWSDAQLGAFLMAVAIRGMDAEETRCLTRHMLDSGDRWDLASEVPQLVDKHSTGGVGDKVSLLLAPVLAACGVPVVMLTGRSLGHTGGTADKLESIPGLRLELDRQGCLDAIGRSGLAIGVATDRIAPADRRLYALRDTTATVSSLPLIVGSILSKKLAAGAAAIVFDVKMGSGAFLTDLAAAVELGERLVEVTGLLGRKASALVTDMSQPLGEWVGHTAEVREVYDCFAGGGEERLLGVTYALCREAAALVGVELEQERLAAALASGEAQERFERWAEAQGATPEWLARPSFPLAPEEVVIAAPRDGVVSAVDGRQLGLLLGEAGAGRSGGAAIDPTIALRFESPLGTEVRAGDPHCRLYLRRHDAELVERVAECFEVGDEGRAPELIPRRIG